MFRVLVPVDTDEDRALNQARFVASLPEADTTVEVHLLFVFEGEEDELPEELQPFKSASRVRSVRRAAEFLEDRNIEVELLDDSGNTAADIIRLADELDSDLIVMGGRKRSPAAKVLFGSITQSVLLNTDRPVTVTGSGRESVSEPEPT